MTSTIPGGHPEPGHFNNNYMRLTLIFLFISLCSHAQTTASTRGVKPPKETKVLLDSVALSAFQETQMAAFDKVEKEIKDSYSKLIEEKNKYVRGILDAKDKDASRLGADYEHRANKLVFKVLPDDKK